LDFPLAWKFREPKRLRGFLLPVLMWRAMILSSMACNWSENAQGRRLAWRGMGHATKAVETIALLLIWFCGTSALADTFGLGTAGPGNWGVLETGTGQVSFSGGNTWNPSGISVNTGATGSQANLGINSGGSLNSASTTVINGTYYKHTGNSGDSVAGTTIVGGTVQNLTPGDTTITQAVATATTASTTLGLLANTQTPPNLNNPSSSVTITGVAGRNVINVPIISLGNNISLTLSGPAGASWVVNVTGAGTNGGITLNASQILVGGGVTDANVILNVIGSGANVTASGNGDIVDGILMDLGGMESLNAVTVNGEVISGGAISLSNGGDVQVVPTGPIVPEPSVAAYFTLGPLSLMAVMLFRMHPFARGKRPP
jgi:hypothetical protein